MKRYSYTLLEMLERLKYYIENLEADWCSDKEEFKEMCIRHHKEINKMQMMHDELKQHQDHINELEEKVQYKQEMINFLTNNIEWLEEDIN